jgi:retron-type reverse transcriptase
MWRWKREAPRVISPLLANIYLDAFDQEMKKRGYRIVRYADDILILSRSKSAAENALKQARRLHRRLRQLGYKGEFKKIKMSTWRNAASPLALIWFLRSDRMLRELPEE